MLDFSLLVLPLLQLLIIFLLNREDIGTQNTQWFVLHLESKIIPTELLQILLDGLGHVIALRSRLDSELHIDIKLRLEVEEQSLVLLATLVQ